MRFEIYLQETRHLAQFNYGLLEGVKLRLSNKEELTPLEQSGVLHALQVLIENAIGKAKHTLKNANKVAPTSAYEVFDLLIQIGYIKKDDLEAWKSIIGLRNKIVHDYMNLDMKIISDLVQKGQYLIVYEFLMLPMGE